MGEERIVGGQRTAIGRLLAALLVSVLSLVGFGAVAPLAHAETPGFSTTVLHNGGGLQNGAVVEPGDTLTIQTQYTPEVGGGTTVVVGIPEGVTLTESSLEVPAGNTAIESITQEADGIHITFTNPFPEDVQEGVHGLDLTFDEVEVTESRTIEWTVDGTPYSRDIIVRTPGDQQENVSNWLDKSATGNMYGAYVSVEDGEVVFSDDITDHEIEYTLTIHTDGDADRSSFDISDQLSEYLVYNTGSFSGEITTWDTEGWNQETNSFEFSPEIDGNSFDATLNIPSPSQLALTYTASPDPERLGDLRAEVQAAYEAMDGAYGEFRVELGNTAILGGDDTQATINIGTTVQAPEGPGVGQAFGKSADWSSQNVEPAEDGTLEPPVGITYTFDADLSAWDGREDVPNPEDFVLDRNVVISDALPEQAAWDTAADDFLVVEGMELSEAEAFDGDAAAFAGDDYVGQYAVVDQNLYINIGQDPDTDVAVSAKALITTTEGIWPWEQPGTGFIYYNLENSASFTYSDVEGPHEDSAGVDLIDRGDTSGGVNVPERFSKSADDDDSPIYVSPGESATVDYTFVVNAEWSAQDAVDVTNSYIVDERDPNVFDLSDLDVIQERITGGYANSLSLGADDFDVTINDDGHLVIELSETGIDAVLELEWADVDNRLEVNIPLTTVPLSSQQSLTVENSATLYGADDEPLYWSETTSEASSYGNESEVRKSIRDTPNEDWTQNLRVEVDDNGDLVQDEYVYNLAYIPHGTFGGITITPVVDELPEGVEFVGFVTDDNVDTGDNPVDGPVDIGGNLEAVYDADTREVTVQNQEGNLLVQEPDISANVLVRVTDFDLDTPVANFFGSSSATFTPSDGYPLSIAKVDSTDDEVVINDPASRFQILADDEETVVVEDAFVEDGFLRVADEDGESRGVVVPEPGTYYVEETVAPAGYELSTERIQVTVAEDGTSAQVTFPNVPAEEQPQDPDYAVGDYVWIDSDRDGQQGADEDPLPGVTVELYEVDEDGNRSEEPVATTTTDGNGRYIFDELPAGDYQVRFILTEEQAELYEFTTATSGEDSTADSNAGEDGFSAVFTLDETNEFLTADEDYEHNTVLASAGIDPTWDAGVVLLEEPSEGEEPPTGGEEPPNEGEEPPVEGEEPPAGGEGPPAGGEEPPTQEDSAERDDSPSGPEPADSSGQLPSTGVGIGLWAVLIAGLLVLAGSAMALIARSNRAQS